MTEETSTYDFKQFFAAPKDWKTESGSIIKHQPYKKYLRTDIRSIFESKKINDPFIEERELVAQVFPFKINQHIIDIIDWKAYQSDPLFQLTFPQVDMLQPSEILELKQLKRNNAPRSIIAEKVSEIRSSKNPAPANQSCNRPIFIDKESDDNNTYAIDGLQHKYPPIVLMFHKNAQTCHAYCTYCFRFNQFTGKDKFLENDATRLHNYVAQHPEIKDILMTGGDPATMKTFVWKETLLPLLHKKFDHVKNIRMGTKALTYHPYRFLTEPDADDLIKLFRKMKTNGKHISIMAHFSHFNELTPITLEAARRLREEAGVVIRTQAPIMKYINDDPKVWAKMWEIQISNGMIPYYMFVARDTGPQKYFEVSLAKALNIYQEARKMVSGLSHTCRGPSMSAGPGKICVLGKETVANEEVFILKFLQGRNQDWCDTVFFAKYDEKATWIDQLKPAFGEKEFFFESEYREIIKEKKESHETHKIKELN
jgi:KamA family protein